MTPLVSTSPTTQSPPTESAPLPEKPESSQAPKAAKRRKKLRILIPLGLLAVGIGVSLYSWNAQPEDSAIQLSGRIEGYETNLGAKVGGRVEAITVREGDPVRQGQMIAQLDDAELLAQLAMAKAKVTAAQQQVTQAQLQIAVVKSQTEEAQLTLQQSQGDTAGRVSQAQATVATAQAQLAQAEAQAQQAQSALELARSDRDRFSKLIAQGAISQQQFDQTQNQWKAAQDTLTARQAAVTAAQQQVSAAQGALTQAQTSQINPGIRTAQVNRSQTQQAQAEAQLAAAQANLKQAQAAQAEIQARLNQLVIKSPIKGVVTSRTVEPGEVIAPGTTVLTVVDLSQVYLRGYIPEAQVGAVHIGQPAQVFLDSAPAQPLTAWVAAVDNEASFTPENIYFQADRVTQVFGLKLNLDNPNYLAKPGMPADGKILPDPALEDRHP